MAETYEIATLNDFLKIPPDRVSACLRDVEYVIATCQFIDGSEGCTGTLGPIIWTDDGEHNVVIHDGDGKTILALEVTEDREGVDS